MKCCYAFRFNLILQQLFHHFPLIFYIQLFMFYFIISWYFFTISILSTDLYDIFWFSLFSFFFVSDSICFFLSFYQLCFLFSFHLLCLSLFQCFSSSGLIISFFQLFFLFSSWPFSHAFILLAFLPYFSALLSFFFSFSPSQFSVFTCFF